MQVDSRSESGSLRTQVSQDYRHSRTLQLLYWALRLFILSVVYSFYPATSDTPLAFFSVTTVLWAMAHALLLVLYLAVRTDPGFVSPQTETSYDAVVLFLGPATVELLCLPVATGLLQSLSLPPGKPAGETIGSR